jgi:Arc/MetJ-type ribon-helix-helix transcriptional regulator
MKKKMIAMRLEDEEVKMIEILRKKYFINISEFFRNAIRKLFKEKEKGAKK